MLHLALIGENISHSKSPAIHTALLNHTGIEGQYGILDVPKEALADLLQNLKEKGYRGVNVTVPHKQNILPFLDELADSAQALQAVNTIVFEPGEHGTKLIGHNTDVIGFWQSVPEHQRNAVPNRHIILLGAGGAARAVLAAVLPHQPKSITIVGQSPSRLNDTLALAQQLNNKAGGKTAVLSKTFVDLRNLADIGWVVNATPIGTGSTESPLTDALIATLPQNAYVSDLVYYPSETQLLKQIRARGIEGQNGLGMLIHQAIAAFTLWTKKPLDNNALECVEKALNHL